MSDPANLLGTGAPTVRRATKDDLPEINAIALRSKAHWGYDDAFMEAAREELRVTDADLHARTVFIAEIERRTVGYAILELIDAESAEIDAMFVDPSAIRSGVGTRLMSALRRAAISAGASKIVIQSDPNALGFYENMGAVRVGDRESDSIPGRFLPLLELPLVD